MKTHLLYKNQDLNLDVPLPVNSEDITADLELNTLFNAMSLDDDFIFNVVEHAVLSSAGESDIETIQFRQDILKDCLKNQKIVREIYQIPIESLNRKRKSWLGIFLRYPAGILNNSIQLMKLFFELLHRLRGIADDYSGQFESEGFTRFFEMIKTELSDDYFALMETHVKNLEFRGGVMISANLGKGNEGDQLVLRLPNKMEGSWFKRLFRRRSPTFGFFISGRDEAGTRAVSELKDRGLNLVANALAQSADHIDSFLTMLRVELSFYIGCINLYNQLKETGNSIAFPSVEEEDIRIHSFNGLYDPCLALIKKKDIIGNDINTDRKNLVIISGANQGGKSTFLRSIGLAQLMMQSGMFVAAQSFHANLCHGVFTHYKRKEDAAMESGKLDEELARMSAIVDLIRPNSLLLFNESFTATNEREGSEIARQIINALIERKVKVFFVTHMYELAHHFFVNNKNETLFLQAERKTSGIRTFRLVEGDPIQTSFGEDVYKEVFQK